MVYRKVLCEGGVDSAGVLDGGEVGAVLASFGTVGLQGEDRKVFLQAHGSVLDEVTDGLQGGENLALMCTALSSFQKAFGLTAFMTSLASLIVQQESSIESDEDVSALLAPIKSDCCASVALEETTYPLAPVKLRFTAPPAPRRSHEAMDIDVIVL